jgi:hypothetical protein
VTEREGTPRADVSATAWLICALLGAANLPSLTMLAVGASSFALGSAITVFVFAVAAGVRVFMEGRRALVLSIAPQRGRALLITGGAIAVHALAIWSSTDQAFEPGRAASSFATLGIVLLGSLTLDAMLDGAFVDVRSAVRVVFWILAGIGALGMVAARLHGPGDKSVVTFSEPSHFALAFMYFLAPALVIHRGWSRVLIAGTGFCLAVGLESLTLMLASMLGLLLVARWRVVVVVLGTLVVAGAAGVGEYFLDRLPSSTTSNISTLVWLQGWETASRTLDRTGGIGVGFQQLGPAVAAGDSSERIFELLGETKNDRDGGFLAAKVVTEFGALGVAALFAYGVYLVRSISRMRSQALGGVGGQDYAYVFRACAVVMFSVEVLVRGIGYFSPGAFFALLAVLSGARPAQGRNAAATLNPIRWRRDGEDLTVGSGSS